MARDTGNRLHDPRDADDSMVYGRQLVREGHVADACMKLGAVLLKQPRQTGFGFDKPSERDGTIPRS